MTRFNRQRSNLNSVKNKINKVMYNVNSIESSKGNIKNSLYNGLDIKNIDTLLQGIKWINDDARGQVDWLKTNLDSIALEIDEKERKEA